MILKKIAGFILIGVTILLAFGIINTTIQFVRDIISDTEADRLNVSYQLGSLFGIILFIVVTVVIFRFAVKLIKQIPAPTETIDDIGNN